MEKQIAICRDCRHVKISQGYYCSKNTETNFVNGNSYPKKCSDCNRDGLCVLFSPITNEEKLTKENEKLKSDLEKFTDILNKNHKELSKVSQMNLVDFYKWKKHFSIYDFI